MDFGLKHQKDEKPLKFFAHLTDRARVSHGIKNSNFIFVSFSLILALGWCLFYGTLGPDWAPESLAKVQINILEKELQTQKMARVLSDSRLLDLQVELAQNSNRLPENLAAQFREFRAPASLSHIDLSGLQFSDAKELFSKGRYLKAKEKLEQMVEFYPTSPHVIEAKFLIAESLYRLGEVNEGLIATEDLVQLYPDSKLSGFLLLKMGQIFKSRQEAEKASEIASIIRKNFPNEGDLLAAADSVLGPERSEKNKEQDKEKVQEPESHKEEKTASP